jgi:hypothetical protein
MLLPVAPIPNGTSAIDLVSQIAIALSVVPGQPCLEFIWYRPRQGAAERLGIKTDDAASLLNETRDPASLSRVVTELMSHQPRDHASTFSLNAADAGARGLDGPRQNLAPDMVIGITSRVVTEDGLIRHLPLMDMKVPPGPGMAEAVRDIAHAMGLDHGAVVESGRSYHLYGFQLIDPAEWVSFTARALLAQPFVDTRYVAHRLLAGRAVLRLTTSALKPVEPTVTLVF